MKFGNSKWIDIESIEFLIKNCQNLVRITLTKNLDDLMKAIQIFPEYMESVAVKIDNQEPEHIHFASNLITSFAKFNNLKTLSVSNITLGTSEGFMSLKIPTLEELFLEEINFKSFNNVHIENFAKNSFQNLRHVAFKNLFLNESKSSSMYLIFLGSLSINAKKITYLDISAHISRSFSYLDPLIAEYMKIAQLVSSFHLLRSFIYGNLEELKIEFPLVSNASLSYS